jgi:hypothetical protein
VPVFVFCREPGCDTLTDAPVDGRCPAHAAVHRAREQARDAPRRRAKPQRRIWDSWPWKRYTRPAVLRRYRRRCVDCRRHQSQLKPNERMLVDHRDGLARVLAEGRDPFDPDECELRCSTCSGRKDGGRR